MIMNQAPTTDRVTSQRQSKRQPNLDVADACSCTSCDTMDCFACRQTKCCSFGQCIASKTNVVYESKKIDVKESNSSDSSDLIASTKKPVSKKCCMYGKKIPNLPRVDKSKYSDVESKFKEKLKKNSTTNEEFDRPDTIAQVAAVNNSDKELVYENRNINVKESRSSDCSDFNASTKKPVSKKCCMYGKNNPHRPSVDKSKYSDVESTFKEKLNRNSTANEEFDRPDTIAQVAAVNNSDKELVYENRNIDVKEGRSSDCSDFNASTKKSVSKKCCMYGKNNPDRLTIDKFKYSYLESRLIDTLKNMSKTSGQFVTPVTIEHVAAVNNSDKGLLYEHKKTDVKENNSSDLIGSTKKAVSKKCCMYGKVHPDEPTIDKSKYSDLESTLKEKLNEMSKTSVVFDILATKEQVEGGNNSNKELANMVGAKLSAQIMNLSYKDFKQSLSYNRSDTSALKTSKLLKYDLLQKIKEVYKACSCKVCECLVGKSTKHELCKCKPCECTDCMSITENMQHSQHSKTSKDCCGCNQYGNTLPGISEITKKLNETSHCQCKPCDCIKCADDYINMKSCDCDPCQCVECKAMCVHKPTPFIVAPVVEDSQRNLCQCSPCECIECGRRYGLSSNLMHEMATGTNRQRHTQCLCEFCQNEACEPDGVGSCKCDRRNRVMSKPVERDTHEYDIRTVLINNPAVRKSNRYDTIAMIAALSNNYPNFTQDKTKPCPCDECDCILCSYKEDAINAIKSSQLFTPDKRQLITRGASKCQSWECKLCDKYNSSQSERQKRLCDICGYANYKRQKAALNTKQIDKSECKWRLHECNVLDKVHIKCKKHRPCGTCMVCKRCLGEDNHCSDFAYAARSVSTSQNTSIPCGDSKCKIESQEESLCIYNAIQTLDFPQPARQTIAPSFRTQASMSGNNFKRKIDKKVYKILKCDAHTQYKCWNKDLYKSNSIEFKPSGSYYSDSSSIKTNSKSSTYSKDNGSVTHVSGHKDKSCESSCNSSGYDYPDYLVQFPKSTVETCLKDVIQLNLDKNIKLNRLQINPNSQTRKRYVNSHSYENTISSRKRPSECYEENGTYNRYYEQIDDKRSSHRKLKRKAYRNKDNYTPLQRDYSKKIAAYRQKDAKTNRQPCCSPAVSKANTHIYVTKNKCTQTENHGVAFRTESISSIRIDKCEGKNYNPSKLHVPMNLKEFQVPQNVYDFNVTNQRVSNVIKNDQVLWNCSHSSPCTYPINTKDFFKIDDDYKRIQKTLQEAKEFSSDLIKILEKYEKDNRDFESVSKKLKLEHPSILNNIPIRNKEMCVFKTPLGDNNLKAQHINGIEHELRQIHIENPSIEENTSWQVFPKILVNESFGIENTNIQRALDDNNLKNVNLKNGFVMIIVPQENPNDAVKSTQNDTSTTPETAKVNQENDMPNHVVAQEAKDLNIIKSHIGKSYKTIHKNYRKLMKRTVKVSKEISVKNTDTNVSKPAVISATTETCNTLALETTIKNNKVTSTSINTTVVGQSIKINESTNIKNVELNRVVRKLDAVFASTTEISVCTSIDKMDRKSPKICVLESSKTMQTQDVEGKKPWPISKKNYGLYQKATAKSKGVCILPALELEMKEALQSISLRMKDSGEPRKHAVGSQSQHKDRHLTNTTVDVGKIQQPAKEAPNVRNSNIRRKSKLELELKDPPKAISLQTSLQKVDNIDEKKIRAHLFYSTTEDIERQVKDILNTSLLQPIMKLLMNTESFNMDIENRLPRIGSSKSSCEALKASFLGVRRVSDHTVLVKWNLPRDMIDVQGYELLVDGRAVQKIFSPSMCMAVITCLPHTDKILLTIRTITAMVARTGHYPAASIIYHPRIK